jgi:hypothetical protein
MNKLLTLVIALSAISNSAWATDLDLTKGRLRRVGYTVLQPLAIKNNGGPFRSISVTCGFFHGDELLQTGSSVEFNIKAGETVYLEPGVNMSNEAEAATVDRADCSAHAAGG